MPEVRVSDGILRKYFCVRCLCHHIIDNYNRDHQAGNCAKECQLNRTKPREAPSPRISLVDKPPHHDKVSFIEGVGAIIYSWQLSSSEKSLVEKKNHSLYFKDFTDLDFFYTDIFFIFFEKCLFALRNQTQSVCTMSSQPFC